MAGSEQRPTDDVEGHGRNYQDPEAVDDRGLQDPGRRPRPPLEGQAGPEAGDDTEGHAWRWSQDTEAVDEDQADDDTQGHIRRY